MGWFRSEEMLYASLAVDKDIAHRVVHRLGRLGAVEFIDLNEAETAFQRRFASFIKRCDELDRKLRLFRSELEKFGIAADESVMGDLEGFLESLDAETEDKPASTVLDELEEMLTSREQKLLALDGNIKGLTRQFNERIERKYVLQRSREFFQFASEVEEEERVGGGDTGIRFSYLAGVLPQSEQMRFERMVFRATRGNAFLRFAEINEPITDPETGNQVPKMVFVIMFRSTNIETKLRKICDAFHAHTYDIPELDNERQISSQLRDVNQQIEQRSMVLQETRREMIEELHHVSAHIKAWELTVKKEKMVYDTLNKFAMQNYGAEGQGSTILHAEGWVVKNQWEEVNSIVSRVRRQDSIITINATEQWASSLEPPTYFQLSPFQKAFQGVVDTYGVPRYREANPAMFASVFFPFLFGVMYGDVGHGGVVLAVSTFLVLFENRFLGKKHNEFFARLFNGRYMILLMGFFATYCGFIYNDFLSLGLEAAGPTHYSPKQMEVPAANNGTRNVTLWEMQTEQEPYPFGFDPIWHRASNELVFYNSYKMKVSVIIGVAQMMFGIVLKTLNAIHFKQPLDLIFECIPQFIFLGLMFGYMDFLIILKWATKFNYATKAPPSLINSMISMVLSVGATPEGFVPLYDGQQGVQVFFLVLAVISVPLMLFPKPLIINARNKKHHHVPLQVEDSHLMADEAGSSGGAAHEDEHEEHALGELFVHQGIETIEFVLGAVSNTASYLRLWALSLAHSQLASVFWERVLVPAITIEGSAVERGFFVFIAFSIFAAVTAGVLLCMDALECFLHALRLQWVEFQNKFYMADGHKFEPFYFVEAFNKEEED